MALALQARAQWVAYNDHVAGTVGTTTHVNATTNDMRADGGPYTLKNITDGSVIAGVQMTLTTLGGTPVTGGTAGNPDVGTPLYNTFNTYCYFGANCIQITRTQTNTMTFTGLDPSHRYRFQGSSVRQATGNDGRWGKFNLLGVDSVTAAHQQGTASIYGVITRAIEPLAELEPNEVAIHTGANTAGDMVDWTDIRPGADGTFQVAMAEWYQNTTIPSHGTSAATFVPTSTSYGYALDAFRLEDLGAACEGDMVTIEPSAATVKQCGTVTFVPTICKPTYTPPFTYQWIKNDFGNPIPDATNMTLVLTNISMEDNGATYNLFVYDVNSQLAVADVWSTLTVTNDEGAPALVSAVCAVDLTTITVVFTKPVTISGPGAFQVVAADGSGSPAVSAAVVSDKTVTLTTSTPLDAKNYKVVVQADSVVDVCNGSFVPADSFVIIQQQLIFKGFAADNSWSYAESGFEIPNWNGLDYDYSSWLIGNGTFEARRVFRETVGGTTVNTVLTLTNTLSDPFTNDFASYYFRSTFNWPANTDPTSAILTIRTLLDDFAVVYFNGAEVWRSASLNDNTILFTNYTGGTAVGDAAISAPIVLGMSTNHVQEGLNHVAVLLKQINATSSDATFGLEIAATITNYFVVGGPINIAVTPATVSIPECQPFTLSSVVSGGYKPYTYQWLKNGNPLPIDARIIGADTATLTVNNAVPGDNGDYTLRVTDTVPTTQTSSPAVPVVVAQEPAPVLVSAMGLPDLLTIRVGFDKPVAVNGTAATAFQVVLLDNTSPLTLVGASAVGNNVFLTNATPRGPKNYKVIVNANGVTGACSAAPVTAGSNVRMIAEVMLFGVNTNPAWQYNEAGVDLWPNLPATGIPGEPVDWLLNSYNDTDTAAGWVTGTNVFDGKTAQPPGRPVTPAPASEPVSTQMMLTNALFPTTGGVIPTYYFRKHFNAPAAQGDYTLNLRAFVDDGIVAFFNGQEAYRSTNVYATNIFFGSYLRVATVGDPAWTAPTTVPTTNVAVGDNVVAVYLKQGTPGSSDITMALELTAYVTNFAAVVEQPRLTIHNNYNGTMNISWAPAGGTLQEASTPALPRNSAAWTDSADQSNGGSRTIPTGNKFYQIK